MLFTLGAQQIKKVHSDFNYLPLDFDSMTRFRCLPLRFIAPPSLEELEQRLRSRGTETEEGSMRLVPMLSSSGVIFSQKTVLVVGLGSSGEGPDPASQRQELLGRTAQAWSIPPEVKWSGTSSMKTSSVQFW